jgi:hypothetical protein
MTAAQVDDAGFLVRSREAKFRLFRYTREGRRGKSVGRAVTFAQVADMYIAAHEALGAVPKHRTQWHTTLRAPPAICAMAVADVKIMDGDRVAGARADRGPARLGESARLATLTGVAEGIADARR